MSEDHHASERGRKARTPAETLDHINADHPCCIGVGDAVVILRALTLAQQRIAELEASIVDNFHRALGVHKSEMAAAETEWKAEKKRRHDVEARLAADCAALQKLVEDRSAAVERLRRLAGERWTIIERLAKQHNEWQAEAEAWRSRFRAIVGEDRVDTAGNVVIRLKTQIERLRAQLAERDRDAKQYAENWNKYQTRAEQAEARLARGEEAARRVYGIALLIREHGCRPERLHAILNEIEEAFPLAAAQPEKEWVCGRCGYYNRGVVCTHCATPRQSEEEP